MAHKKVDYKAYISSPQWQSVRRDALMFRGDSCMVCKSRRQVQVHHMHYGNLGNEKLKDLLVLCGGCHIQLHCQAKIRSKEFNRLNKAIAENCITLVEGKFVIDEAKILMAGFTKDMKRASKLGYTMEKTKTKKRSQKSRVAETKRLRANKVYNPNLGTWKSISV